MRTTITIDDSIYQQIQQLCHERGISFKRAINMLLSSGLQNLSAGGEPSHFVQKSYSMGTPYSEYDLIKALESAGHLEASEIKRKLEMRK